MKNPHLYHTSANGNIFPNILDTLEESLFLLDSTFQFTWYNKACDELYRSVSGKPIDNSFDFSELLTSDQEVVFKDQLVKTLAGDRAHFEWNYRKAVSRWVSVSLYPFIGENGKITGICGCMRDITDKKLNEQILRRNTAVMNSISEGVVLVDGDFNILTFNRRAHDMMAKIDGQPRLGENFINLLPPERRIHAIRGLHAAFRGERVEYEELYAADFWILINCHPVKNDCGEIKHISISFRNITERKRSEERLKASEKKYRSLVNSLSEGVILQTADKTILTVNKNAELILGLTAAGLMQNGFPHPDWNIVDKNEKDIPHDEFFCKKNGRVNPVKGKVVGIRKNNDVQWLRLNVTSVSNPRNDEPYALVISFEDITEQKRMEGELKILSMVAKETMNAVLIMYPNGEILWVNEGFTRLTGYSAEEIIGTTSRQMLFGPETDMKSIEKLRYARENGLPFESVQTIYTKQGAKIWTKSEGQPMKDANGVISRIFVIVTDITTERNMLEEMKVLSEERLQNQIEQQKEITRVTLQAQEAERNELGRELHDNVNQLLAAVNLQLCYCINNYKTAKQVIRESKENVLRAMEEIRSLSHKMVMPRFSATSLEEELNGLINNFRFTQNILLETKEWDEKTAPQFIKETFFRIAQEKLNNIYKHAQAKQITIHIRTDKGCAFMCIKDDGIGFDPAQKKKGIGLANIINRVEAHNGTCQLVSAPGMGCTLSVSIPYTQVK